MSDAATDKLTELRAQNLPRLDWRGVFTVTGGELLAGEEKALADYFRIFVKGHGCVCCGAQQGAGNILDAFIGKAKFRWGIVHGEGICTGCGWPARAYHRDVGPLKFLQAILQYHPDELKANKP